MNDEWWMMNDEWWMMNDEWWMMNDEWWMMNEEELLRNKDCLHQQIYSETKRSIDERLSAQGGTDVVWPSPRTRGPGKYVRSCNQGKRIQSNVNIKSSWTWIGGKYLPLNHFWPTMKPNLVLTRGFVNASGTMRRWNDWKFSLSDGSQSTRLNKQ